MSPKNIFSVANDDVMRLKICHCYHACKIAATHQPASNQEEATHTAEDNVPINAC